MPASLIEFPADDSDRARRFWHGVFGVTLAPRPAAAGPGWQTDTDDLRLGVHERGPGPGDTASLPYFTVVDTGATAARAKRHSVGRGILRCCIAQSIRLGGRR